MGDIMAGCPGARLWCKTRWHYAAALKMMGEAAVPRWGVTHDVRVPGSQAVM